MRTKRAASPTAQPDQEEICLKQANPPLIALARAAMILEDSDV
jgi:hypothetical protein